MKIYASSKLAHKEKIANAPLNFSSSWLSREPESGYSDMWDRYLIELIQCDVLLMYFEIGDVPKGALVELGAAMATGSPVVIVYDGPQIELERRLGTIIHHKTVTVVHDFDAARELLKL